MYSAMNPCQIRMIGNFFMSALVVELILLRSSLSGDNLKLWVLPKPAPKRKRKYRKTELAKRRKLIREDLIHYHPTHLPRIIKSDVRRQYAFMYSNVFNQCDYDYMIQFVQTFIKPRSTVSVQRTGELSSLSSGTNPYSFF